MPMRHVVVAHRVDERRRRTRGSARRRAAASPSCGSPARAAAAPSRPPSRRAPTPAGSSPASPKCSSAAPVRWPAVPSARIVTRARMSEPGSKRAELLALAPAALVAGPHADDDAVRRRAAASPPSPAAPSRRAPRPARRATRPSCESETTTLPLFRIVGGGGIAHARGRASGSRRPRPAPRRTPGSRRSPSEPAQRPGLSTAPESRCAPGAFPFSSTATGTSPSAAAVSGSSAAAAGRAGSRPRARPARRRRPARRPRSRPRPSARRSPRRRPRRRVVGRPHAHELRRSRTSSRQLRHDLVQVADDAEVGELEDRRVRVLVDRDDRARALHADLVLDRAGDADRDVELRRDGLAGLADLRRVRVPARVDDGARRGDRAAERLRELLDEREALGRAEPAAAGDDDVGVLDRRALGSSAVRLLDQLGARRAVLELDRDVADVGGAARARPASNVPGANDRERDRARPAGVDVDGVAERGCVPTSAPSRTSRSTRSQLSPASSRAASPAATSDASTDCAKSTPSKPSSRTSPASTSTRGCGSGAVEPRIVGDEDGARRRLLAASARHARAGDDAGDVARRAARAFASTPSDACVSAPSWCSRKTSSSHSSRLSARNSTIASAASPSSSTRCAPRRARGGGLSASTVVARRRRRRSDVGRDSVSCGFFFAPMIPFSDG